MVDMTKNYGVEEWAGCGCCGEAQSKAAREATYGAIAKAMRYKAVWEKHRHKLRSVAPTTTQTASAVALRGFIAAMDRAQDGEE